MEGEDPRECLVCDESEPSFIHTLTKTGHFFRHLCTDCLLKQHRIAFCPICLNIHYPLPPLDSRVSCPNCPFITHIHCSPPSSSPSSSSASCLRCTLCSDSSLHFFPRTFARSSDQSDGEYQDCRALICMEFAKALVVAAKIAMDSMSKAVTLLKKEADEKILESIMAKGRAKVALWNLHREEEEDILFQEEASLEEEKEYDPKRRKISDL